ncbi:MAG TPA: hypothetical protein VK138_09440 [Acidiferrobacterales bacterium]|nr:hypothetical protein [Acidiferrobacterales bacterium]
MKDPKRRATPMDIDDVSEINTGYKLNGEMQKSDTRKNNNKDRLRQNQTALGVNEEHKTKAMQKHKRGTFP